MLLMLALTLAGSRAFPQAAPEDLQKRIAALEAELARLKAQGSDAGRLDELARRIDLLAAEMEKARTGGATDVEAPTRGEPGLGPAASKIYSRTRGVSIGGYGEVLFGAPSAMRQDGAPSDAHKRLDLLRYVTYLGYKFSDKILLNSEVEFEHATTGEGAEERGEASVEFAYLEFRPWKNAGFRAGELLMPLGFLNELHEPPIFQGARRNQVETQASARRAFARAGSTARRAWPTTSPSPAGSTSWARRGWSWAGRRSSATRASAPRSTGGGSAGG
jgi:uncharacterized small protein (DUF1192 family)